MNKKMTTFCTIIALTLIFPSIYASEPIMLTEGQMDGITGGKASVQVGANAAGYGNSAYVGAHTSTYAHQYTNGHVTIDVSYGSGYAHGYGSNGSNANVSVNANTTGDITVTQTSTSAYSSHNSSIAYGWGVAVSISFHH
jgi:hypothetical protein